MFNYITEQNVRNAKRNETAKKEKAQQLLQLNANNSVLPSPIVAQIALVNLFSLWLASINLKEQLSPSRKSPGEKAKQMVDFVKYLQIRENVA